MRWRWTTDEKSSASAPDARLRRQTAPIVLSMSGRCARYCCSRSTTGGDSIMRHSVHLAGKNDEGRVDGAQVLPVVHVQPHQVRCAPARMIDRSHAAVPQVLEEGHAVIGTVGEIEADAIAK